MANAVYRRVAARYPWEGKREEQKTSRDQQYQLSPTRSGNWIRSSIGDLDDDFLHAMKKAGWEIVCVTASAVASHPFYVIAVRSMGQFVGRETSYKSVLQSIGFIYENEGVAGMPIAISLMKGFLCIVELTPTRHDILIELLPVFRVLFGFGSEGDR